VENMAICSLICNQYTRGGTLVNGVTSSMIRQLCIISSMVLIYTVSFARAAYYIKATHPRLFIEDIKEMAGRSDGRCVSTRPAHSEVR
jgi:hypothetical protein